MDDVVELTWDAVSRPCLGERVNGDAVFVERRSNKLLAAVIDGVGHGPEAGRASQVAVGALDAGWQPDLTAVLTELNSALEGTRGAVCSLVLVDLDASTVSYSGVGNVAFLMNAEVPRGVHNVEGILGHRIRTPRQFDLPLTTPFTVVLHSDGVSAFGISDYPRLVGQSAAAVSRTVVKRFGVLHDDATCLVVKGVR
jgi:hypothetical protein